MFSPDGTLISASAAPHCGDESDVGDEGDEGDEKDEGDEGAVGDKGDICDTVIQWRKS